jgi:ATP-dependent Clp endopeptidase proteolytic subunit ClpP
MFNRKMQKSLSEFLEAVSNDNDDDDFGTPEQVNNSIYFYCKVNTDSILAFNKQIRELDKKNYFSALTKQGQYCTELFVEPIVIYIQSPGGELESAFSAIDTMLSCKSPIYTVIDGMAASAATLMSVVGTKRFITPNSYALIHQLSSGFWGQYEKMKEELSNCSMFMERIKTIYLDHTKIEEEDLVEILKKDLYFDAKKCLELGIVDEIR